MRTLLSALAALLALLIAAGGLTAAWVDVSLVEESGFVALAAPLGTDQDFQAALGDSLAGEVAANTGLPDQLKSLIEPIVREAAGAVSGSSAYPTAWTETLRLSHSLTLARAPEPTVDEPAVLTLDLAPIITLLSDNVAGRLGVEVPLLEDTTIDIGRVQRGGVLSGMADAVEPWPLYLGAAGIVALLALVIARRRGTTLALLGLGLAGIGLIGLLAGAWLPGLAVGAPGTGAVADVFLRGLTGRAAVSIAEASSPIIMVGLLAALTGVVARLALGRHRRNRP